MVFLGPFKGVYGKHGESYGKNMEIIWKLGLCWGLNYTIGFKPAKQEETQDVPPFSEFCGTLNLKP